GQGQEPAGGARGVSPRARLRDRHPDRRRRRGGARPDARLHRGREVRRDHRRRRAARGEKISHQGEPQPGDARAEGRLQMKRALLAVLLACSCAGEQKPAPAGGVAPPATAKSDVQANAEPKPVADKPPVPMVAPSGAKPPLAERDPWADRTDLFVAPTVTPTTKVNLGAVERFTLPNGLQVIVVPRREVPVINLTLALRVGHSADPLDRSGLAQFTASMLRKGTDKRTSDQIAQAIDFVGGELEASSDDDGTFVACQARAKDLALCLDL